MGNSEIRWEQRFSNYNKALTKLDEAVNRLKEKYESDEAGEVSDDAFMDDILKEGLIQRFEYTHELAWNVMKDFLQEKGEVKTIGSKDSTREAFSTGLISNGEAWMEMIQSRNRTSHTYNESTADEIFSKIMKLYHSEFLKFRDTLEEHRTGKQGNIFDS